MKVRGVFILVALAWIAAYLAGVLLYSFATLSLTGFDITQWTQDARLAFGLLCLCLLVCALIFNWAITS